MISSDVVILTKGELECIKTEAFQRGVRRGRFEEACDKSYLIRAADVARGEVYEERYRTWPWWEKQPDGTRGNRHRDDPLVRHCEKIAAAILGLAYKEGLAVPPILAATQPDPMGIIPLMRIRAAGRINATSPEHVKRGMEHCMEARPGAHLLVRTDGDDILVEEFVGERAA